MLKRQGVLTIKVELKNEGERSLNDSSWILTCTIYINCLNILKELKKTVDKRIKNLCLNIMRISIKSKND